MEASPRWRRRRSARTGLTCILHLFFLGRGSFSRRAFSRRAFSWRAFSRRAAFTATSSSLLEGLQEDPAQLVDLADDLDHLFHLLTSLHETDPLGGAVVNRVSNVLTGDRRLGRCGGPGSLNRPQADRAREASDLTQRDCCRVRTSGGAVQRNRGQQTNLGSLREIVSCNAVLVCGTSPGEERTNERSPYSSGPPS